MLFPVVQDAAAQSSRNGYTYTQRVCQELGQQPRHYQVRDEMDGSDWRSDGGWAIVLIRGTHFFAGGYEFYGHTVPGGAQWGARGTYVDQLKSTDLTGPHQGTPDPANPVGSRIVARDGTAAFVTDWARDVYIDRDNDGQFTVDDLEYEELGLYGPVRASYRTAPTVSYGTTYIRWANMLWCR